MKNVYKEALKCVNDKQAAIIFNTNEGVDLVTFPIDGATQEFLVGKEHREDRLAFITGLAYHSSYGQ